MRATAFPSSSYLGAYESYDRIDRKVTDRVLAVTETVARNPKCGWEWPILSI